MATSTPHAECLAAFDCAREVVHIRSLCCDLGFEQMHPTVLEEDNQSLIRITINDGVDSDRSKHWDYKVHWLRERIDRGDLLFAWVASGDQMADGLTKALPRPALERQRDHNNGNKTVEYPIHDKIFRENAEKFNTKEPAPLGSYVHYALIRHR